MSPNTMNMKSKNKSKRPEKHQRACLDTEPSPDLSINRLPDEVLLEVFDCYRQSFGDQYNNQWRKKYAWFNLAHVCRNWRAVVFASYSRLDLNIVVGPKRPSHIKTILPGHLPILIDYFSPLRRQPREIASTVWRMRTALGHRDRVREISLGWWSVDFVRKFISATNYNFPALESLVLRVPSGQESDIPTTFLKGPDQSDLPLRRLDLEGCSLSFVSRFLSSATALTDLTLNVPSNLADSRAGSSQESILLACLQGTQCLRSLNLKMYYFAGSKFRHSIPKDIFTLSKLTHFHYDGTTLFLNNLISRLLLPSLQDVRFDFCTNSPFLYLSRVIDYLREEFRSVSVNFDWDYFRLSSSTHSGKIDQSKPSFSFNANNCPHSITKSTPSTKLALVEELALRFPSPKMAIWKKNVSMSEFLRQFCSVRVLRVSSPIPFGGQIGLYLQQDDGEPIFPLLEEIELSDEDLSDEDFRRCAAEVVAGLEPFASARERVGRLVKVYRTQRQPAR